MTTQTWCIRGLCCTLQRDLTALRKTYTAHTHNRHYVDY